MSDKLEEARALLNEIHHGVLGMDQAERHLHVVAKKLVAAEATGFRMCREAAIAIVAALAPEHPNTPVLVGYVVEQLRTLKLKDGET